jgi:molybdenum cofactor guanylyltransferase
MTVIGLILAGGRAKRMDGQDKGLITLEDRTLVEHTLARFSPQVDSLFISANRNFDRYRQFGCAVLEDRLGEFEGPLAGLHRLFEETPQSTVILAPCDAPLLSGQLVSKLLDSFEPENILP